jgi:hypothetical protein
MFTQAIDKSSANFCFLDWKGMNKEQRNRVTDLSRQMGVKVRKSISKGEADVPEDYRLFNVNKEIFILAEKMDSGKIREVIIKNHGVPIERSGHLTNEFKAPSDIRDKVLRTCYEVLRQKKPFIKGKSLIIEERKFDPKKAEELGLKPGPEFSLLQKGFDVKIGENIIKPDDVVKIKKKVFELDNRTLGSLKKFNKKK